MSDLRETGALEQDADLILLLYRAEYYDEDAEAPGEIIIGKNRRGPCYTIHVSFVERYASFEDLSRVPAEVN